MDLPPRRSPLILALPAAALLAAPACLGRPDAAEHGGAEAAVVAPAEAGGGAPGVPAASAGVYDLSARSLAGAEVELSRYAGQVALVVNVASECGLTPQYAGLQALHAELADRGFTVLAFPSNDFGGQEPGGPEQIRAFCTGTYGVEFPLFEKVVTKAGPEQSPVYARLAALTGELPSWNFSKYVVGRDGRRVTFFGPRTDAADPTLRAAIEAALAQ